MSRRLTNGIDVDRLDQLIKDLGVRIRLYKSTLAPNMNSLESMDQDLNDNTSDHNMVDFDCVETVALLQQQDLVDQFKVQGTFHIDEILITFLSGQTTAPFAKIELLDFQEDFYELLQRQVGTSIDRLKYKACSVLGIFSYNKTTKEYIRYYYGTDFTLQDGDVKWLSAHKPSDKQVYSIYYKYHPVYRIQKAVHRDRFSQFNVRPNDIKAPHKTINGNTYVKMPETWVAKRDYLISRPKNTLYDPNT